MPVPILTTTKRQPERILAIGGTGSGKSNAIMSIANRCQNVMFHVVDNDNSINALLDEKYPHLQNVAVYPSYGWADMKRLTQQLIGNPSRGVAPTITAGDWFVCDIAGRGWSQVQDWYTQELHQQSMANYFMEVRKVMADGSNNLGAFDGFTDWAVINAEYNEWKNMVVNAQSHVWCTAEAEPVRDSGKLAHERAIRDIYSSVGFKPVGQKTLGHIFRTQLLFAKNKVGGGYEWKFTTIKDLGREPGVVEKVWTDFGVSYLGEIAGWKMEVWG